VKIAGHRELKLKVVFLIPESICVATECLKKVDGVAIIERELPNALNPSEPSFILYNK